VSSPTAPSLSRAFIFRLAPVSPVFTALLQAVPFVSCSVPSVSCARSSSL
jgi:hypothetical protein